MAENPVLVRFHLPGSGPRTGLRLGGDVYDLTAHYATVGAWLRECAQTESVAAAVEQLVSLAEGVQPLSAADFNRPPDLAVPHWLAPIDEQDVWAAGVTYERSREARQEEAIDGGDVYARVYGAVRPEIFFKGHGRDAVGPWGDVGIRADASWSVPEPELTLLVDPVMRAVGYTIGNDMSSRDIEGANPLYLPQAKIYTGSCAIGPGVVLGEIAAWPMTEITLTIRRGSSVAFTESIHTRRLKRTASELLDYLGRSSTHLHGVAFMTGTGIVPPGDFTLAAGDEVEIAIEGVGVLINTVTIV